MDRTIPLVVKGVGTVGEATVNDEGLVTSIAPFPDYMNFVAGTSRNYVVTYEHHSSPEPSVMMKAIPLRRKEVLWLNSRSTSSSRLTRTLRR